MLFLNACKTEPQPIGFGSDGCEFCKMTIMDNKFGAELITAKGKVYKFDSAECMIRYIKTNKMDAAKMQALLVVDHVSSGKLIDATGANYYHSENHPSPMGAGLSAFEKNEDRSLFIKTYGGESWTWEQAMQNINP